MGLAGGDLWSLASLMTKISYRGYRFPPVIIQQAVWLYARFTLSFRDVEDLLAERGIVVSYETLRRWVNHFGSAIAADGVVRLNQIRITAERMTEVSKRSIDAIRQAPQHGCV
jgi:transposase-like protein